MTSPRHWMFVVILGVAIIMVDGFDLQSIGYLAPEIGRSWSVHVYAFGRVFGAGMAGTIVGALIAGPAARLAGERSVLVCSLVLFGFATLLCGHTTTINQLLTLRLVAGVGLGAAVPLVMVIVANSTRVRHQSTAVVVALCGQPVGAIVGGVACAYLVPRYGWAFAFYLGGILPLVLTVAALLLPEGSPYVGIRPACDRAGRLRELFAGGLLACTPLFWAVGFLAVLADYMVVNWLPSSIRQLGYPLQISVLAMNLFNFGGIGGAIGLGFLIDRFGTRWVLPIAFGLSAAGMALLDAFGGERTPLLLASLLVGVTGYGAAVCLGAALTLQLYPARLRAAGMGWCMATARMGAVFGPIAAGAALKAGLGIGRLFYIAAAASIIVMFGVALLTRLMAERDRSVPRPECESGLTG